MSARMETVVILITAGIVLLISQLLHKKEIGIIFIFTGCILLVVQLLINPNKSRPPHYFTAKQQKGRMIIGGFGFIILGIIVVLLS